MCVCVFFSVSGCVYVIMEGRGVYNYVVVYVCVNKYGRGWGEGG